MWTNRQRGTLIVLAGALLVLLAFRHLRNPSYIPHPQPLFGERAGELQTRIDPNVADAATLSALPEIGPAMAQRIVEEREAFLREHPGATAYVKLEDLDRVRGIGQATLNTLEPHLIFPETADRPTTRP